MANVFASPDIAALVAAFLPPLPTREQPSLVRSSSGGALVDSRHIRQRFRNLLETSPSRIILADLPRRLGFSGKPDWLLDGYHEQLVYGQDRQSLLPKPEITKILKSLVDESQDRVIDAESCAKSANVSTETLKQIIHRDKLPILWWNESPARQYLYSSKFAKSIEEHVRSRTAANWTEGVDLSQNYDAPASLLLQLARSAHDHDPTSAAGEWAILNDRTVFVPASYATNLEAKKQAAREAKLDSYVEKLRTQSYCKVQQQDGPNGSVQALLRYIETRCKELKDIAELVEVPLAAEHARAASTLLVAQQHLDEAMSTLRIIAPQETARVWHARPSIDNTSVVRELTIQCLEAELSCKLPALLLRSPYVQAVSDIIDQKTKEMDRQDRERFERMLTERVLTPLLLYASGIATVQDETLKQHLEEYLGEHFRREIIPQCTTTLQEERLLIDRSRKKDYDKFSQASADAKTLSDIQSALTKLTRKQKVPQPDETALRAVKHQILQTNVKNLRKLPRGSDTLQNLIWILLACASEGLYMSYGKDTTRMIRQYRSVAGGEMVKASKLEEWRDALKAGKEDAGMLKEMREMAAEAVEAFVGP